MATLQNYVERMPFQHQRRYDKYWVGWANALLERMSGMGVLPPKRRSHAADVEDGEWVDVPPLCRDVLEIRDVKSQYVKYRFEEINGRLRLYRGAPLSKVSFGVAFSASPEEISPGDDSTLSWDVSALPGDISVAIESDPEEGSYESALSWEAVTVVYMAAYEPIASMGDEIEIGPYDNLIEAWLRWKVEEHEVVGSPECGYWRERVDIELHQLRGEMFSRINRPVGRKLIGFM